MPSSTPTQHDYDENLLAAAPKPDKRQIQGGYNADLLKEKPKRAVATPTRDPEAALASREPSLAPLPPKKPFYRSTKGLVIIAAVVIAVLIAAIVGGVVGSKKKNGQSDTTTLPVPSGGTTAAGSTTQTQQQGGGPIPSGSPGASSSTTIFSFPGIPISGTSPPINAPTSVTTTDTQQQGGPGT